jgi:hypothetical protein
MDPKPVVHKIIEVEVALPHKAPDFDEEVIEHAGLIVAWPSRQFAVRRLQLHIIGTGGGQSAALKFIGASEVDDQLFMGLGFVNAPPADAPRSVHEDFAKTNGFYWLPCPRCGKMTGGHEKLGDHVACRKGDGSAHSACCKRTGVDPVCPCADAVTAVAE